MRFKTAVVVFCIGVVVQTAAFHPSSILGGKPSACSYLIIKVSCAMFPANRTVCDWFGSRIAEYVRAVVQVSFRPSSLSLGRCTELGVLKVPNLHRRRSVVHLSHCSNLPLHLESWSPFGSTTARISLGDPDQHSTRQRGVSRLHFNSFRPLSLAPVSCSCHSLLAGLLIKAEMTRPSRS